MNKKKVGEGAFGQVVDEGGESVRKLYDKLKHMIQETMVLRYISASDYVVKLVGFNTENPSIRTKKWSCSLSALMRKKDIPTQGKMRIFKHVLLGLSHMHSCDILQSDLKLSNILVNDKTYDACICDLGLSSVIDYAKVYQTAPGYSPKTPMNVIGHDMFGLCISMVELFGNIRMTELQTAQQLRVTIREMKNISNNVKSALIRMCPDDPRDAATADKILYDLFDTKTEFKRPEFVIYEDLLTHEQNDRLFNNIKELTEYYHVNRGLRCFECTLNFFNSPVGRKIDQKYKKLYIASIIYVFACLFGKNIFDEELVLKMCKDEYTIGDLQDALKVILSDDNFVNMVMYTNKD